MERRTAVKRNYHTIASSGKANERQLTDFLSRNGQFLLPMMELIEQSRMAVEELIDVAGRVTIEAVLRLSAQQVAGEPSQGKPRDGDIGWHGTQKGTVYLRDRKLPVNHGFDERAEARARRFRFQRMWRCRIGRGWELECSTC